MESPILLVKEAAEYLRVSPDVIYNYCNSKPDFPAVKVGGQWRIHKALLDDWWFGQFLEKQKQWDPHVIGDEEAYMTTTEVVRYLRLPAQYVYNLCHAYDFPAVKIDGRWRTRKDLLKQWTVANREKLDQWRLEYEKGVPGDGRFGKRAHDQNHADTTDGINKPDRNSRK